jgi:NAD(P)-dependent dehydrogenase (short-subunit alcohol dehydrogenase family)
MQLEGKTMLVTGGNRGIGKALVTEALGRGAERVYAGTRVGLEHADERVVPLLLDVTDTAQIEAAAATVAGLDVLINNAGLALYDDLTDPQALQRSLAVNLYGPLAVTQAFVPALAESRGAVVNILSIAAWAALPIVPAYSASKAAAFNMTQSLRALFASRGITVQAALLGPVDTEMNAAFDIPKASPESVAAAIFDGIAAGDADNLP